MRSILLACLGMASACHGSTDSSSKTAAAGSAAPTGPMVHSPIRIDLPDRRGWKAYPTGSSTLLMLVGPHDEMLTAKPLDHEPTAGDLRERMTGADDVRIGDADPHDVHASTSGEKIRGWMHALQCGEGWVLLYFYEADDTKPPASADLVTHVRCLAAGEPDVAWPST